MNFFLILIPQSLNSQFLNFRAIMWQNQHFLRGLRVFNFVLIPNVESRFQRETCERLRFLFTIKLFNNNISIYTFTKTWNSFPHKLALFYTPVQQISLTFCTEDGIFLYYFVLTIYLFQTSAGISPQREK